MNIFGNPQGVTYRYICLHVSSEGRSPEASYRSQAEAALRDKLVEVACDIFTYIIHINTWKTRFPFIAKTDFRILLLAAAGSNILVP